MKVGLYILDPVQMSDLSQIIYIYKGFGYWDNRCMNFITFVKSQNC